jgi:hypothetical protein
MDGSDPLDRLSDIASFGRSEDRCTDFRFVARWFWLHAARRV